MAQTEEAREVLTFEGFTLDRRRGCLRATRGAEVPLAPKPFDLLCYLAIQAGRTVSKNELLEAVWPGVHVMEDSLFQAVREARRAIGDEQGRVLRAVPRRGYLLDATVTAVSKELAAQPAVLVSTEDRPSLVVLPFANLSGDPEQEYFADGMVEEITTALSRIRSFVVIARSSAFTYKGRAVDVRQIGRELGVRYVLEGSVFRAAGRTRIAGRLVDTETGWLVWADRFDGTDADVFDLQDQVTEAVAVRVAAGVRGAEIGRAARKRPESLTAYDMYLRALPAHHSLTRAGYEEAAGDLLRALAIEPGFARAAAMACIALGSLVMQGWTDDPDGRIRADMRRLARQALAADPEDGDVVAMAARTIAAVERAYSEALELAERAVALSPNSALAWGNAGWVYTYADQPELALKAFARTLKLDPVDPRVPSTLAAQATCLLRLGRLEEAVDVAEAAARKGQAFATALRARVAALALAGRGDEARSALSSLLTLQPRATLTQVDSSLSSYAEAMRRPLLDGLRLAGLPQV